MTPRPAPDFNLPDQHGVIRSLKDYAGRWVVLFFYPKDDYLGCIQETCSFRDEYRAIKQFGDAEVIGINKAKVSQHMKFAKKYGLNFPILSDESHKVTSAYSAWRSNKGKFYDMPFGTRRNTYFISPSGDIVDQLLGVNPKDHALEVIAKLQDLQKISRA